MKCLPKICFVFLVAINSEHSPVSGDDVLTGVIVDAASGNKLHGVAVNLYKLYAGGEEPSHVDSATTNADGVYRFTLGAKIRPMRLSCLMFAKAGSQHLYGPVSVEPLIGGEGVVNIALTSSDNESLQSAQARLRNLSDLLKSNESLLRNVPTAILEDYVSGVVVRLRDEHDVQFGSELATIADAIRSDNGHEGPAAIGFAKGVVWQVKAGNAEDGELTTWNLPENLRNPVTVKILGRRITLPFYKIKGGNSRPAHYKYNFAAGNSNLCMLATDSLAGHEKTWAVNVSIDPANDHAATEPKWSWGAVTSTAGQSIQPFTARGSSNGTITIFSRDLTEVSVTPPVGQTPVVATAFSRDGAMIAGACINGAYKIWALREGGVTDRKPLYEGNVPELFPSSIAFSPDGKSILFGTGLRTKHAGVALLELTAETSRFSTRKTEAAITQIQFLNRSDAFICRDSMGLVSVWKIEHGDDGLILSNDLQLSGIEGLSVNSMGIVAVKVENQEKPVLLPVDDLVNKKTFTDLRFGIKRTSP